MPKTKPTRNKPQKAPSKGPTEDGFYTYMLECADGTYYTGWTTNVEKRLNTHNEGKGARYTKPRRPVYLKQVWAFDTKSEAMKFEYWIKTLPRFAKEKLIKTWALKK